MSFAPILQKIVDETGGALGAALMGGDGVAIEQVRARAATEDSLRDEVAAVGAEFGRVLDEIRKASDALGGGPLVEALISLSRFWLLFRAVDEEILLVLVLGPEGNLGKARYLVRRTLPQLREQL